MADDDRNKAQFQTIKQWMLKNILLLSIVAAVVLGLIVGFTARLLKPSVWVIWAVGFPGNIYLSMIKLVILPLIMSSLICAIVRLDLQHLGKMGGLTIAYYLMTTLLAVILGIALVVSIHPGNKKLYEEYKAQHAGKDDKAPEVNYVSTTDSIFDVIRNLFPENIVQAMMQSVRTVRKEINSTSTNRNVTIMSEKYSLEYTSGTNILGIIVFSLAFGIVLSQLGDEAKKMIDIIAILEKAVMKMISWIMWVAPIGIFSLITGSVLGAGDFFAFLQIIGLFLATALLGLLLHCLVVLPALYFIITGQSPLIFLKNMSQAMITAFGIASSAATMPVTLNCLEEGMKIDKRITRFVIPLGATINMDGLALYEAVAAIFIAQMQEGELPFYKYLMIALITILSSIGAAAVPSGGIIAMVMVLAAIQLPAEDIVIIVTLDWFMDRLQTMANVIGDAYGACIIAHFCQDGLDLEPTKSATNSGQNDEESGRNGQEQPVDETESHLFDSMTKTIPPVPTAPVDGQNIKQYQDATRTVTPQISSSMMSPQTKY